ncbi:MAG: prephenate dehydratase [Acidimicrobiia bacterium]
MRIGFQGEELSYSDQASQELFPDQERVGFVSFVAAFEGLRGGKVDRLVLPIENSTTGSVLPVLDRLLPGGLHIVAEHLVEVRHALLGLPGADPAGIRRVLSHPEALAQAEAILTHRGWEAHPVHDTAGAVRQVAERGDPSEAALAPEGAATRHGLRVLMTDVVDRLHNTTRFVVVAPGEQPIAQDADKTTVAFSTLHQPGALALALTELGLRGANLTRIESRPSDEAWRYRFYVDLLHEPGPAGYAAVFVPTPATLTDLHHLGTYRRTAG